MKKKLSHLACVTALVAAAAAAQAADKRIAAAPLASAGSVTVTPEELKAYAKRAVRSELKAVPPEQKRAMLVALTVRKTLAEKAVQQGLDKDPLVAAALDQWKMKNYPKRYFEVEVDAKVHVSDEELRREVGAQEEFELSAINLGNDAELRSLATGILEQLAAGADFAELARRHSVGNSAVKGGDVGWQPANSKFIPESQLAVLRRTKIGGVTPPLETPVGLVIYQVRGHRTAEDNFATRKDAAAADLLSRRRSEARSKKMQELRSGAQIIFPAKTASPGSNVPLAMVNGLAIYPQALGQDQHRDYTTPIATDERLLEQFIAALLVVQEAERVGIGKDPALKLEFDLERIEILANLALRRNIAEPKVTEAELRAEHQRYYVPDVYLLQVIHTPSREKAEEAARKLRGGADFGAVAKETNVGRLSESKGQLAPGPIVDYPREVREAIEGLPDGGVTGVIKIEEGRFGIFRRVMKKVVAVPSFEAVSAKLLNRLVLQKRSEQLEELMARYAKEINVTINEALLKTL